MNGARLPTATDESSEVLRTEARVTLRGVAFLAPGFDFAGGMEGQARLLAQGLAARGVPVTFVTTTRPEVDKPSRETLGLINVFRVPVLRSVDWATSLDVYELAALGILRARLQRLNVIYAVHHEVGAIAARLGQALGLPSVVKLACSGEFGDAHTVARHPDRRRITRALRRADRVIAISQDIAGEAIDLLGIAPERIVRLGNGVDLQRFRPRPWKEDLSPRILFMGRLGPQKRVDVLLEAFAELRRRRTDSTGLELIVAGDGPLEAELRQRARALGVEEHTRFPGRVPDVVGLLRDASVFVLPSVAEGASNALLEAMATGVPVVATRLPSNEELATDGEHALLVPPGDSAALAAAIERLLDDATLRRGLVEAARARAESFDLTQVAAQHVDLFDELAVPRDNLPEAPQQPFTLSGHGPVVWAAARASLRTVRDGALSTGRLLADQLRRRLSPNRD